MTKPSHMLPRGGGSFSAITRARGTGTFTFRHKVMRGEHFLLLAEREQLLPPEVLTQLRQILKAQKRPAKGEAVARLLVNRGFLTVEVARRLIATGSGPGSPLVGSAPLLAKPAPGEMLAKPATHPDLPLAKPADGFSAQPRAPLPAHSTAELILDPTPKQTSPPLVADQIPHQRDVPDVPVTSFSSPRPSTPSAQPSPTPPPLPPPAPPIASPPVDAPPVDEASFTELSDSFAEWMDFPEEPSQGESPSPLFAARPKLPTSLLYIGLATAGLFLLILALMILTKLRGG